MVITLNGGPHGGEQIDDASAKVVSGKVKVTHSGGYVQEVDGRHFEITDANGETSLYRMDKGPFASYVGAKVAE